MTPEAYDRVLAEIAVTPGTNPRDIATCLACGFTWDDAISTSMTPAPSGRCPNEYNHPDNDDDEDPDQYLDGLEEVPAHHNDLGDWCPYGADGDKARTADGTCPQFCREADEIVGFDAGRDNDNGEEETG